MGFLHPISLLPDELRQGVGNGHRAVVSPGAAHGDDQGGLPLLHVLGQQESEELFQMPHKLRGLPVAKEEGPHRLFLQLGNIIGVGQETHIEDQVGVDGNAVLEAEGGDGDRHALLQRPHAEQAEQLPPEFGQVEPGGVENVAGPPPDGLQRQAPPAGSSPGG